MKNLSFIISAALVLAVMYNIQALEKDNLDPKRGAQSESPAENSFNEKSAPGIPDQNPQDQNQIETQPIDNASSTDNQKFQKEQTLDEETNRIEDNNERSPSLRETEREQESLNDRSKINDQSSEESMAPAEESREKTEKKDRRSKREYFGKDHDDDVLQIGIGIGFTEEDYYLSPRQRVGFFGEVVESVPTISVFANRVLVVDSYCVFPTDGYYTALIPKNDVFQSIIVDVDTIEEECEIIKHYIVPDLVIFDDIDTSKSFETLAGTEVTVTKKGDHFYIGDVEVVRPVAYKDRGILIHVLDGDIR